MTNQRPDPDELLSKINEQEERTARGKLKIFFGASAGVGKTYAMLAAAQQQRLQKVDVVIGVIETHGRRETETMTEGLERLPLKDVNYRGAHLREFDLDAALARRPALILIDELAHTNLCNLRNARHPKRWQDVEELLNAGITVYTTVNVQHILSLNDVVGSITGIQVRETVPDHVFDEAHEIVLVDLPTNELLQRLAEGKVYLPQQAKQAQRHFFRKGNLLALRELALRRTADRVDEQMRQYRRAQDVEPVWQARESMLVCIGPQANAEQVVRNAARIAAQLTCPWHAIYVETPKLQRLPDAARQRILLVLKTAHTLGAETATVADHNEARAAAEYARKHNLSRVVIGSRPSARYFFSWRKSFAERLTSAAPELDVIQIAQAQTSREQARPDLTIIAQAVNWKHYLGSTAICALTTLLMIPLHRALDLANGVMLFLVAVVGVALRFGRGPAVLAAFLSVGAFDFFFVPPRLSFSVADIQYLVTFAVMLSVALVIGQLMANLKFQARVANSREARAQTLYEMSRELSTALVPEQIAEISARSMQRIFAANTVILLPGLDGNLSPVGLQSAARAPINRLLERSTQRPAPPMTTDLSIAQWAYDHEQAAGFSTDTLPASPMLYLPLKAPMRVRGVLAIEPKVARWMQIPEQQRLLSTFAALIALALERVHYVDVAQQAQLSMEAERLRNSVLAAVSHDLRTPLTALIGFADTLLMKRSTLHAEEQETVQIMRDLAGRMNALVNNLLDMARLQAGGIKLNKQWQPLEEVIGTALRTAELTFGKRKLTVDLPSALPLVEFDAALIERVLVNLLENAAKYTPPHAAVRITAVMREAQLEVSVIDNGPGLPTDKEEIIFEKFTRGQTESTTPGIGLGLAICKTIMAAHGGHIHAVPVVPHGAHFIFTLPQGTPPSLEEPPSPY